MKKVLEQESIQDRLDKVHQMMNELTDTKIILMGKEYDLKEWITLSDYAKKYDMTVDLVSKWIAREVVPAGHVLVIPQLNYLRLIKDQPYSARSYEAKAE